MSFPANEDTAVFYNPVQVQNRDLSVLMITLAAERRAVRAAVQSQRKLLRQQHQGEALQEALEEYQASLNGTQLVADQSPSQGIDILDALAASGLRSMRYWKEIPGVRHVTVNDLEAAAVERAQANLVENELSSHLIGPELVDFQRQAGICVQQGDAKLELYLSQRAQQLKITDPHSLPTRLRPRFDVIDLDPYGSGCMFFDGAVQAVEHGGLLAVTSTDMAALGGAHPETCFGRYAGIPIQRAGYLQELALRLLLASLATSAARYGRTIRPILSVGMDFYVRVFVEVYDDKAGVQDLSLHMGSVYQATQLPDFVIATAGQKGGKSGKVYQSGRAPAGLNECNYKIGGPMWLGALHDRKVVSEALKRLQAKDSKPDLQYIATKDRLIGLLTSCEEELDAPLYYKMQDLASTLGCSCPPIKEFKGALVNAGYEVSGYHKEPQAIKTTAPNSVVWDIMRSWYKKHPPKNLPKEGSPAARLLAVEPTIEADFSIPQALKNKDNVARFPHNPQSHWGPKPKASGKKRKAEDGDPAEDD